MEVPQFERPAFRLVAGMAAGNAVQPSLDAAGQREVGRVDRQDERTVEDAAVKPLRQHNSTPWQCPRASTSSSHSLIQENCIRRQFTP
jgi:hypothetical protein